MNRYVLCFAYVDGERTQEFIVDRVAHNLTTTELLTRYVRNIVDPCHYFDGVEVWTKPLEMTQVLAV